MRRGTHSIITRTGVTTASTVLSPADVRSVAAMLAGRGERVVPERDDAPSRSGHDVGDPEAGRTYDLDIA